MSFTRNSSGRQSDCIFQLVQSSSHAIAGMPQVLSCTRRGHRNLQKHGCCSVFRPDFWLSIITERGKRPEGTNICCRMLCSVKLKGKSPTTPGWKDCCQMWSGGSKSLICFLILPLLLHRCEMLIFFFLLFYWHFMSLHYLISKHFVLTISDPCFHLLNLRKVGDTNRSRHWFWGLF